MILFYKMDIKMNYNIYNKYKKGYKYAKKYHF